jgi:TRAP-type C4-dicarboxylate transport system permease small subunit
MDAVSQKDRRRTGWAGAAERVITAWAILGGFFVLAVVGVNVVNVVGGIFGRPFAGDFELTQMGIAVAAFAFLPYCQLTGQNVTADIFTARAGPRLVAVLTLAGSVVALLFAILLTRQVYLGMGSQYEFGYSTAILNLPVWWAYAPAVGSLGLLVVAALITTFETFRDMQTAGDH